MKIDAPATTPNSGGAGNTFAHLGSMMAGAMFVWAILQQFLPHDLRTYFDKYSQRFFRYVYPYIQITFNEYGGERFMRSEAYSAIENYLSSSSATQAKRLKADMVRNNQSLVLSMDDHEEVSDEFNGVKLRWTSGKRGSRRQSVSFHSVGDEESGFYKLIFHKKHRDLILGPYLSHVLKQGKEIRFQNRQRKLYTNNGSYWNHVVFEHPATFNTIAMHPDKKQEIIDDLMTFSQSEDFYARIGRAWKRGYLLFGPPGTGKSTMIAAMANLLKYDIYDLELTAVRDNTSLRRLLIETSSKSIIVIEDIDCSLDLTGQRKKQEKVEEGKDGEVRDPGKQAAKDPDGEKPSRVTLSGLLNFIDGLWSSCGGERLLVFTTNHIEKLDPALIRKGRMDKHVELSYCRSEAFKVLAKNYLGIDAHHLFDDIGKLLNEVDLTPADVAEHLMPRSPSQNAEVCLEGLVVALEKAKMEGESKAEEAKLKGEESREEAKVEAKE
ncbi:AAA-ATPase ASD, mitochondrial-like [Rhodamnia argentea]|uniref:AAA-ATPase ASD, mitochondrial-like n=1 Tax=Rhodamnia argentea TaxID=178133 RepID=A0A8B8N5U1_9MYRT|nr:AAA-ATPase ASD, mitochondrial-like [Rhodamnia argentea]